MRKRSKKTEFDMNLQLVKLLFTDLKLEVYLYYSPAIILHRYAFQFLSFTFSNMDGISNENGNNDGNVAVAIDDGIMQMRLGTNGIKIETGAKSALVIFDPVKNCVFIGSGANTGDPIDLCIGGKIVDKTGNEYIGEITVLKENIRLLEEKVAQLEEKIGMVYYAPGFPGYILAEQEFNDLSTVDFTGFIDMKDIKIPDDVIPRPKSV